MPAINKNKLLALMKGSAEDRYGYFIRKIVDFEEVWGLYKDGWAMAADENKQQAMPFWPEADFAEACAIGIWNEYQPQSIKLEDFINKWLPGMQKDKLLAAVFFNTQGKGVCISVHKLAEDISSESNNYL